jgi:glucose/arabinose dehydrogenase
VGQFRYEEIDVLAAGAEPGANLGWNRLEGNHLYEGTASPGSVLPVFEYPHEDGGCAVIGGHVYRGSRIPELRGAYLFGDLCTGRVTALRLDGKAGASASVDTRPLLEVDGAISSFGVDAAGEIYVLTGEGVYRLEPA